MLPGVIESLRVLACVGCSHAPLPLPPAFCSVSYQRVSQLLGSDLVNVNEMSLALHEQEAFSVYNIDNKVSTDMLERLRAIPGVRAVQESFVESTFSKAKEVCLSVCVCVSVCVCRCVCVGVCAPSASPPFLPLIPYARPCRSSRKRQ